MFITKNIVLVKCFLYIFILILPLIFVNKIYAEVYFEDNFENSNLNKWEYVNGNCSTKDSWQVIDGKLKGEISRGRYSYLKVRPRNDFDNFEVNYDAINTNGVDQPLLFKITPTMSSFYMVNFRYDDLSWPQDSNNVLIGKFINGQYISLAEVRNNISVTQNITHKIRVVVVEKKIKVYFDSKLIADINDSEPFIERGSIGFFNWGGDFSDGSSVNYFDNFIIKSVGEFEQNKIIILPGLGASWNTNAMVYNNQVTSNDWRMTPFVNNYDGLISTLEGNGLVRNKDYYVWNYDWRKPLNEIVSDFNNFMTSVGTDNVDLVGHSLGGVVARIWKQDQINNGRQINVYTLGSPNNGSVDAYSAWSGGVLSTNSSSFESLAMNILLQLNKLKGLSSFRKSMPILKDLLPTYDFVKKQNKTIRNDSLVNQNIFLNQKNNEAKNLTLNLKSYLGVGEKTKEFVKLANNTVFDNMLGRWPDGKLISYTYDDGDGVVLRKNANLNINGDITNIKSNHEDIVNKSLSDLILKLNLESKGSFISNDFSDSLVFFIGSPVSYSVVCDNSNSVNDVDGFVIIKNNNYKKCTMDLVGTGNGVYHLVYGNTNLSSDKWHYVENAIQTNEKVLINFNPNNGEIIKDNSNVSFIHKLVTDELNLLVGKYGNNIYLTNSLKLLKTNDVNGIINNIFLFRKVTKENNVTISILDNLEVLSEIIYSNNNISAQNDYLRALQNKSLIDKMTQLNFIKDIKPNEFSALSYIKANDLLEMASFKLNTKDYTSASVNSNLSEKFLKEVW